MTNQEVAQVLEEIGEMLEILGESPYRVRAYQRAANAVRGLPQDLEELYEAGKLISVRGIGTSLAEKIEELLRTGKLSYFEELKKKVPPSLITLMQVPGVGPKKAKLLHDQLGITSVDELYEAVEKHQLRALKRLGAKTEENIRQGILLFRKGLERILLYEALPLTERVVEELKKATAVKKVSSAGSLRRLKETVGDIDILVASESPRQVMEGFVSLPGVRQVLAKGETKSSVIMASGLQVDLRVVRPQDFGSALQYFTGSKEHNIRLREIAKKQGLKISEYGIFEAKSNKRLGGEEESEIYQALGLTFIPAVLRENRGEIEAALEGKLPNLVTLEQIKGDLHVHSVYSDGSSRLEDLIEEALKLGYEYVAVCDHAERLKIARGMSPQDVEKRLVEIKRVNQVYQEKGVEVLSGVELNIENNGEVDYPAGLLAQFDLVSASIHWGFGQSKEKLTERILKAMENPYVNVICHPTGRIIGKREPYQLDFEAIFQQARATNIFLELNSFPDRLDLKDELIQEAKKAGCKFALGTDAHGAGQLGYMRYGVATAQRGWLEPQDVLNTYPLPQLLEALGKPT